MYSRWMLIVYFSGTNIVSVDSPIGRLGLTVCYDLRFPKIYQQLRFDQKAQVTFYVIRLSH